MGLSFSYFIANFSLRSLQIRCRLRVETFSKTAHFGEFGVYCVPVGSFRGIFRGLNILVFIQNTQNFYNFLLFVF